MSTPSLPTTSLNAAGATRSGWLAMIWISGAAIGASKASAAWAEFAERSGL